MYEYFLKLIQKFMQVGGFTAALDKVQTIDLRAPGGFVETQAMPGGDFESAGNVLIRPGMGCCNGFHVGQVLQPRLQTFIRRQIDLYHPPPISRLFARMPVPAP